MPLPWRKVRRYRLLLLLVIYAAVLAFGWVFLTTSSFRLVGALCLVGAAVLVPAAWRYQADGDIEVIRVLASTDPTGFARSLSIPEVADIYDLGEQDRQQLTVLARRSPERAKALAELVAGHREQVADGVKESHRVQWAVEIILMLVGVAVGSAAQQTLGLPSQFSAPAPGVLGILLPVAAIVPSVAVLVLWIRLFRKAAAARRREEAALVATARTPEGMVMLLSQWLPTTEEVREKVQREARMLCQIDSVSANQLQGLEQLGGPVLRHSDAAQVKSYQFIVGLFFAGILLGAVLGPLVP